MKRIAPINLINKNEYEGARRIVRICAAAGIVVSCIDAYQIWKSYSDVADAEWVTLPIDDTRILKNILEHSQEV